MGVKLIIKGADFSQNGMHGEIVEPLLPLPEGYTRLSYIEGSGTIGNSGSYINTGFKYTGGEFRLELKADILQEKDDQFLCGAQKGSGNTAERFACVSYYPIQHDGAYFTEGSSAAFDGISLGTKPVNSDKTEYDINFDLSSSGNGLAVGGTSQGINKEMQFAGGLSTNLDLFVFAKNSGGSPSSYTKARLYKFKLTVGGNPVMNLVPCIDDHGVYGVYDTVRKEFYGSATSIAFTGA